MRCAVSSAGVATNAFQPLRKKETLPTVEMFHSTAPASRAQQLRDRSAADAMAKGPRVSGRSNVYLYEGIYPPGLVPGYAEGKKRPKPAPLGQAPVHDAVSTAPAE